MVIEQITVNSKICGFDSDDDDDDNNDGDNYNNEDDKHVNRSGASNHLIDLFMTFTIILMTK